MAKLTADVVDYETTLLLSKVSMKKANAMIDFKDDKMISFTLIPIENVGSCKIMYGTMVVAIMNSK